MCCGLFYYLAAQKYPITLELHKDDPADTLNVHHLALAVQKVSSVPVNGQKLIYKGKKHDNNVERRTLIWWLDAPGNSVLRVLPLCIPIFP